MKIETLIISSVGNCKGSASVFHQVKLTLKLHVNSSDYRLKTEERLARSVQQHIFQVIAVALMIQVTIVSKFSLDKAMAKYEDMDGTTSSPELPIVTEPLIDLNHRGSEGLKGPGSAVYTSVSSEWNYSNPPGLWFGPRMWKFSFKCPHRPVSAPWAMPHDVVGVFNSCA
ncbi:hypothetical protein VNO77_33878 [Canavalia gladiata]|uniref:Uncharacterized protein n=1 Tax=Canavalia gladiata TaxID=3824 RepID=A0AAN9KF32_CANGL